MSSAQSAGLILSSESVRWFDAPCPTRTCSLTEAAMFQMNVSHNVIDGLRAEAERIFAEQEAVWISGRASRSAARFLSQHTGKDRLAHAVHQLNDSCSIPFVIHDSVHEICSHLCTKSTQHYAFLCRTIQELFMGDKILPKTRCLRAFAQQSLHALPTSGTHTAPMNSHHDDRTVVLFLWLVEDRVKSAFSNLLTRIETEVQISQVVLLQRRTSALHLIGMLMSVIPEEQSRMCALVVEKLKDPNARISGKCAAILTQFMQRHSSMQRLVMNELEALLFQPTSDIRTQTLAIHVLNQFVFNHQDTKLPARCVTTYFSLFRHFLTTGEIERKIVNGIMVGLKRAVPYVASFSDLEVHFDTLFTMAGAAGSFHHRVAALNLLQIVIEHNATSSSITPIVPRFYRSLYHLISFDPVHLPHNAHLSLFFSLLYRVLRHLRDVALMTSFVRRILQSAMTNSPAYACAALMLIGELHKSNNTLRSYILSSQKHLDLKFVSSSTQKQSTDPVPSAYKPMARDPQYTCAHEECVWELHSLCHHFHPTVVKFAKLLLLGHDIDHGGHPLDDFTIVHFCELFSGKKPNKRVREMHSIHQRRVTVRQGDIPTLESIAQSGASLNVEGLFITKYEAQKKHAGSTKEERRERRLERRAARKEEKEKRRREREESVAQEALRLIKEEQGVSAKETDTLKGSRRGTSVPGEEELYPTVLRKYLKYSYDDLPRALVDEGEDDVNVAAQLMKEEEQVISRSAREEDAEFSDTECHPVNSDENENEKSLVRKSKKLKRG